MTIERNRHLQASPKWQIEWWALVRGLAVLFSSFLAVTILYSFIRIVSGG